MWKCKWYYDEDRYYGVGTIMNACWDIKSSANLNSLDFSKSWNLNDIEGLLYPHKRLTDWQMLVPPGLM